MTRDDGNDKRSRPLRADALRSRLRHPAVIRSFPEISQGSLLVIDVTSVIRHRCPGVSAGCHFLSALSAISAAKRRTARKLRASAPPLARPALRTPASPPSTAPGARVPHHEAVV